MAVQQIHECTSPFSGACLDGRTLRPLRESARGNANKDDLTHLLTEVPLRDGLTLETLGQLGAQDDYAGDLTDALAVEEILLRESGDDSMEAQVGEVGGDVDALDEFAEIGEGREVWELLEAAHDALSGLLAWRKRKAVSSATGVFD